MKYGPEHHPNDSPRDGTIHDIAQQQLSAWQRIAEQWPLVTRECNVCRICGQNVWFTADMDGSVYEYSREELLALVVAHIRQVHPEANDGSN